MVAGADASLFLFLGGVVILLGFVVHLLFKRTGISDALFLLFFGLVLGSYFHVLDPRVLLQVAPFFGPVALLIILMDGGISLNLYEALRGSARATVIASLGFLASMAAAGAVPHLLLGWSLTHSLLFGAIVGNATPLVVFSLIDRLRLPPGVGTVLKLEATIAEIFAIVVALALLDSLVLGQASAPQILRTMVTKFSIGGMMGLIGGLLWYFALQRLRGQPFTYMVTLAIAFLVYSLVESVGGSGPVSALLFGLTLGNEEHIAHMLKHEERTIHFDEIMKSFHGEISFFIRTFFFVYLGAIVTISDPRNILYGALAGALLLAARYGAVALGTLGSALREHRTIMAIMVPRGLAAAVLSILVLNLAQKAPGRLTPAIAGTISDMTFSVIITTILLCTLGALLAKPRAPLPAAAEPMPP